MNLGGSADYHVNLATSFKDICELSKLFPPETRKSVLHQSFGACSIINKSCHVDAPDQTAVVNKLCMGVNE